MQSNKQQLPVIVIIVGLQLLIRHLGQYGTGRESKITTECLIYPNTVNDTNLLEDRTFFLVQ